MKITLEKTLENLKNNDDFLIICHRSPDGDTMGSGYGLYHVLKGFKKRARVVCSDEIPKTFRFLQKGYIDEDFEPKYIITVDLADSPLLGGDFIEKYGDIVDMSIDHHISNSFYAKETYLNAKAANTENIYDIAKALNIKLSKEMANCLYTGLATDTGCFKFSNTTAASHNMAAKMIDAGADYKSINTDIFDTMSKEQFLINQYAYSNIKMYLEDKCAILHIPISFLKENEIRYEDLDSIAGITRQIEGVKIGVTFKETEDGYRISFRSIDGVDSSFIASKFSGGGHKAAAGGFIANTSFEDVKKQVLEIIKEVI